MKPTEQNTSERFTSRSTSADAVAVVRYLEWCRITRGRSPQTLASYASTLSALLDWAGGKPLDGMDRTDLDEFVQRPRRRAGRPRMAAPATRKREVSALRAFYRWAVDEGVYDTNPAANLHGPTVATRNPKPVEDDVWKRLWFSDLGDYDRAFLGLGYFCGLRRQELSRLVASQVTSTRIRDFVRKGGGDHTLPWLEIVGTIDDALPDLVGGVGVLSAALSAVRRTRGDDLLLPWGRDPINLNRRLDRLATKLDLGHVTPHQLRHSAATNLVRAGVPLALVASLMNHTSTTITMRYVRAGGGELAEWRQRVLRPSLEGG